jgi:SAM-dependent methyltransferase
VATDGDRADRVGRRISARETEERNRTLFGGPFGAVYSFYIGHEPIARLVARVLWGGDVRPFFASMAAIGEVPAGGLIVDAPCGAGVAFRGLSPSQDVRYLAVDLSPRMVDRAAAESRRRGLLQVELEVGDMMALPIGAGAADLVLSYWGLHCLSDPETALDEVARVLRPGGRLIGASLLTGGSLRQRLLVRPHHSAFGAVPDEDQLGRWLERRFTQVELSTSGPLAYFSAHAR